MGYGGVVCNVLPWVKTRVSDEDEPRSTNITYPIPQPRRSKHPMGFSRESVARIVVMKPRDIMVRIQPIHIWGRYRPVTLTDNPAEMAAGARDANASV